MVRMLKNKRRSRLIIFLLLVLVFLSIFDPFNFSLGKQIRYRASSSSRLDFADIIRHASNNSYEGSLWCQGDGLRELSENFSLLLARPDLESYLRRQLDSPSWRDCRINISPKSSFTNYSLSISRANGSDQYSYNLLVSESPKISDFRLRLNIILMAMKLHLPLPVFTPCLTSQIFSGCQITRVYNGGLSQ